MWSDAYVRMRSSAEIPDTLRHLERPFRERDPSVVPGLDYTILEDIVLPSSDRENLPVKVGNLYRGHHGENTLHGIVMCQDINKLSGVLGIYCHAERERTTSSGQI